MEVESRGARIAYDRRGAGPAVVLIPGFLMTSDRWIDTGYVDRLSPSYTVIAVDPLGFGRSDRVHDPAAYAAELLALDTIAVLDAEGIERAVMWGYSRGAGLAYDLAALHPDRVRALVAGGAPVQIRRSDLPRPTVEDVAPLMAGDWESLWSDFPVPLPDDVKRMFERTNDPAAAAAALAGTVGDFELVADTCPKLFYVGGGEWFADVVAEGARDLGAEFHRLGDYGHAETHQAMGEVCDVVEPFLESL